MRIVLKFGTNIFFDEQGRFNTQLFKDLISEITNLHSRGQEIVIVTSGAVGMGMDITHNNDQLSRSSLAAIGQAFLIKEYARLFQKQNITVAQILLTPNVFKSRGSYDHLKEVLENLILNKIIPILNENDVTTHYETFGDNDALAGIIAVLVNAQKLVYATNLDGLYSEDPSINPRAELLTEVENIDLTIQKMCSQGTSLLGRGGMLSKIKGAKLATTCGITTYVINGLKPENIKLLLEEKIVGTRFTARDNKISDRKKWLLTGTVAEGIIIVDNGARKALENKNSLLAVGVRGIKGDFEAQDFVSVKDGRGEVFAFGIVNYGAKELKFLKNLRDKDEINRKYPKEIIHLDNLTLLK